MSSIIISYPKQWRWLQRECCETETEHRVLEYSMPWDNVSIRHFSLPLSSSTGILLLSLLNPFSTTLPISSAQLFVDAHSRPDHWKRTALNKDTFPLGTRDWKRSSNYSNTPEIGNLEAWPQQQAVHTKLWDVIQIFKKPAKGTAWNSSSTELGKMCCCLTKCTQIPSLSCSLKIKVT